jgi:AcrR family transcriptional regulator
MPKATFFNLSEEKKDKIIKAARKEFSRVSLYESSISNIIKDAEIPRGSFYQYFEDKEDLFFTVLKEFKNTNEKMLKKFLKDTDGDLIEAFIFLYEYLLKSFKCEGNINFYRNVFLNMSHKMEQTLTPAIKKEKKCHRFNDIFKLIDITKLNIIDEEDTHLIFKILIKLTMSNVVESFSKQLTFEESMKSYKKLIYFVRNGICKK